MTYKEKVRVAKEKEAKIASEYMEVKKAREECVWGGHCASCMYRKGTVQVSYDIMDRMDMAHDYCMNKKKGETKLN